MVSIRWGTVSVSFKFNKDMSWFGRVTRHHRGHSYHREDGPDKLDQSVGASLAPVSSLIKGRVDLTEFLGFILLQRGYRGFLRVQISEINLLGHH